MNKILGRIFTAFACLFGTVAGAYLGLLWSVMLARREHSEEDVTYDWPNWVLGGAAAGGFFAFIIVSIAFAVFIGSRRRTLANEMRGQITDNEQTVGTWPPASKQLPPAA